MQKMWIVTPISIPRTENGYFRAFDNWTTTRFMKKYTAIP